MGMGKSAWRCEKDGLRAKARNPVQLFLTQHPGPGAQPTRRVRTERGLLRRQPGQLLLGTYKERCLDFKHFFHLWHVSAPLFHCRALKYQVLNTKGHGDARLTDGKASIYRTQLYAVCRRQKRLETCTENARERTKSLSSCSQTEQHPYRALNEAGVLWKQVIMWSHN